MLLAITHPSLSSQHSIRDWSLIRGRGGGYKTGGGGGQVRFYPYKKGGGGGKGFSHLEGGGAQKVFG